MSVMRNDIINCIIQKYNYKSYLEIGVFHYDCYKFINCELKECVDPKESAKATYIMTSDDFFRQNKNKYGCVFNKYDCIFIDGLHLEQQVLKDIENSLDILNDKGTIIVHDCLPENEFEQRDIEKYDDKGTWTGTVWKAFARLRITRPDLEMYTVNENNGCGVIRKGKQNCFAPYSSIEKLDYNLYAKNRIQLMNIISFNTFKNMLEKQNG